MPKEHVQHLKSPMKKGPRKRQELLADYSHRKETFMFCVLGEWNGANENVICPLILFNFCPNINTFVLRLASLGWSLSAQRYPARINFSSADRGND